MVELTSVNLGDVKTRVKRQFGDDAGVQIRDTDIVNWVNDAQREIANQNDDLLQVTASADVLAGISTYNLPVDCRLLRQMKYNGLHLRGLTKQDFNEYIDGLQNPVNYSQGNPLVYNIWAGQFTVFPTPSTAAALVAGFTIDYLRNTVDVANDTDNLEFPSGYHNHIVEYCLRMAYELDENWGAAQQVNQRFQTGINQLKERDNWAVREVYPSITVRAEDQVEYFPGWF
jgi:hypothetical protein